jgi:[ribosomal protein S18]-alanine N-acetyltransferase
MENLIRKPVHPTMTLGPAVSISRLQTEADTQACARLMASSEPWLTLGRTYDASLRIVQDSTREIYVARDKGGLAGFLILCMSGAFVGYIQTICIQPDRRGQGLGSRLVEFAEQRILEESPNVFMCVSSFNRDAQRLYERLGYHVVGELTDYIVEGHSEVLLRKTVGPLATFVRKAGSWELGAGS